MLGFQHQTLDFCVKEYKNGVFHPVAPFGILRGGFCLGLGLAVRSFCSDLEKLPTSASGEILEGSGQHFGLGTFLGQKMVRKKLVLWRNDFVVGFGGNPSCTTEFYGPWDPYGQATLSQNPSKNDFQANSLTSGKLQVASGTSLCIPYSPFKGPLAV